MGISGSVQWQIVPCSGLYFFLRSVGAPQMHCLSINWKVLISYFCHFQSNSLFFVYFGFLCLKVSLVSRVHKGAKMTTFLGSLFQLSCGEGKTLPTNNTGMCGECSQWDNHTGFATAQGGVYFPGPHCSSSRVLC